MTSTDITLRPVDSTSIMLLEDGMDNDQTLQRYIRQGLIGIGILVFGLGGLAATLPMAGAVIAPGQFSVESYVKQIGHPFGGVVSDILVKNGDHVRANQPLIKLDSTVSSANSSLTGQNVDQLLAREARLLAERDGRGSIDFPKSLTDRANDPVVAAILADERRNFEVRNAANRAQIAQLNQRVRQSQAEISSAQGQLKSYNRQSSLIEEELDQTRELYQDRLTTLDRLNALERSAVGVQANSQSAASNIAQASARISEYQAQAASVGANARSAAAAELVQVQSALAGLKREQVAADDNFDRSVIRAPQAGIVDKLQVQTIGAVIPAGETILEIVPDADRLTVRASVSPTDIDQIHVNQKAVLRLSGLNMRTTPELIGKVVFVAADRTVIQSSGVSYYDVTIEISEAELNRVKDVPLRVGMPVEAFIQTSERTMLSYLVRPLLDQIRRAFRSD